MIALVQTLLIAAKTLIKEPENWMKGSYDNAEEGNPATCFCSMGAVYHAAEALKISGEYYLVAQGYLYQCVPVANTQIIAYNDAEETTHDDIMKLFDCAINAAENR